MPRSMTINTANGPVTQDISVRRAETIVVTIDPSIANLVLTVANSPGGVPLVEIPDTSGTVTVRPSMVSSLTEGRPYFMNIWDTTNEADPLLLAFGKFTTTDSIEPSFVDHPTQWPAGSSGSRIVQNRGTDVIITWSYKTNAGDPKDMSGYTFTAFEPSAAISSFITITPIDLAQGEIEVRIEWDDSFPVEPEVKHSFRVQASLGADDIGSELIELVFV